MIVKHWLCSVRCTLKLVRRHNCCAIIIDARHAFGLATRLPAFVYYPSKIRDFTSSQPKISSHFLPSAKRRPSLFTMSLPMDELAVNVLNTLKKPAVSSETKLAQLNSLKSSIKHQRIPDSAQPATVECVRLAIASQTSPSLVSAGFSSLTHLVKRLALQEQLGLLFAHRANLTAVLLERLGDAKEAHRAAASQAFCDIWPGKQVEVEKVMRDGALVSGNTRAKLAAMQWVAKVDLVIRYLHLCRSCLLTNNRLDARGAQSAISEFCTSDGWMPGGCRRHGTRGGKDQHCGALQVRAVHLVSDFSLSLLMLESGFVQRRSRQRKSRSQKATDCPQRSQVYLDIHTLPAWHIHSFRNRSKFFRTRWTCPSHGS